MKSGKRKKGKIICAACVVIVLAAVFVVVFKSGPVRNAISNAASLGSNDASSNEIDYERCDAVCVLGNGLAAVSENGIRTLDGDGGELFLNSFTMYDPYLESNGETALTCDIGKNTVKLFDLNSVICSIETDNPIISAHINDDGWFAVCTRESSYTSSVTVYNNKGTAVYKWYSGEGYILGARVGSGNKDMAVLVLSRSGSEIVRFKLSSEEEQSRYVLENEAIIDFNYIDGGKIAAVTAGRLLFINDKSELSAEYDYSEYHLSCYDIQKGIAVLGLWNDKFGEAGRVVAVKSDGAESGCAEIEEKIADVSWAGKTCAVLLTNEVRTFSSKSLKAASVFEDAVGRSVIAQRDGSVLVTGEYMTKYLK